MTEQQQKLMQAAGLSEADFRPKPGPSERLDSVEQRTGALETTTDDMILMMADLIGGD